jgi:hypothetical protein
MNICDLLKANEESKKRKNENNENNKNEIMLKKTKFKNESNFLKEHNKQINDDIIVLGEEPLKENKVLTPKKSTTGNHSDNHNKKYDENELKLARIQNLLRIAKQTGNDSFGGQAKELPPHPGLYVENYGNVPLPINEDVGEKLIKLSKQAPYGYKYDTLLNKEVRDTFQIEPSSIQIKNPQWNDGLKKLTGRVAESLGCHGKIEAKLYKMLIYKQGGHFKKHSDTEKDKNMFATLILQLPSIHEGCFNFHILKF